MVAWDSVKYFRIALRLQQLQKPHQFRLIHLHHASTTKHVTGNHRIKEYKDIFYPNTSDYELELWDTKPLRKNMTISFSDILESHVKPGFALLPLESKHEETLPESEIPRYCIGELNTKKVYETKISKGKGRGSREFHFKVDVDSGHFAHSLFKSYHILSRKTARSPIEIHIHYPIKRLKVSPGPSLENVQRRKDQIAKHEQEFKEKIYGALHLWPETILRAMPEGTAITIAPVANKDEVCWVMDLGGKDKNQLFEKNRKLHQDMYEDGTGMPDKETRKRVKQDLRDVRLVVRSDLEAKRKREAKELKKQSEDSSTEDLEEEDEKLAKSVKNNSGFQGVRRSISGETSFESLTSRVDFNDILKSTDNPALIALKKMVKIKMSLKGTMGLLHDCDFEGLGSIDCQKVYAVALLLVRQRVKELEDEQLNGTLKVQEENKMILERTKDLYHDHPDVKQLNEEIKRRLDTDLARAKRKNDDKIRIELRKMNRRRLKLMENLGPNEKRELLKFEGGWSQFMYQSKKKPKPGYTWLSRGSSTE
ncbi:hypothetical protein GcM1_245167 [Golovinomyces cichoracearum]|uniref:Uncharacterized protein n=1 Tax=Golovinomyces cichoracearum TaxID=62708 RepID=A0A420IFK6_9PEZI|nr:hypothetical protein GcM1_245167 [Golovinomyces cichoracearum]